MEPIVVARLAGAGVVLAEFTASHPDVKVDAVLEQRVQSAKRGDVFVSLVEVTGATPEAFLDLLKDLEARHGRIEVVAGTPARRVLRIRMDRSAVQSSGLRYLLGLQDAFSNARIHMAGGRIEVVATSATADAAGQPDSKQAALARAFLHKSGGAPKANAPTRAAWKPLDAARNGQ